MEATINQLSFRDVLHTRERIGSIHRMVEMAQALGYPYILWNDRVYKVDKTVHTDTGLTVCDVV